jgi:hypothetical protein
MTTTKNRIATIFLFLFATSIALGQNSSLVYPGSDGKLVYEKYANQGEDTLVNIIPDFSFAGYMQGGVPLPEDIPVRKTLEPTGLEDDRQMIQSAIDEVSALAPDENGFRGTILLKKGIYKVNGSLIISASGVVLRGEGQLPGSAGGTELIATAPVQHSFIKIEGNVEAVTNNEIDLGHELVSFDYPEIDTPIVLDVSSAVKNELDNDSLITLVAYSIEGGNFKFYSKEIGDSTKMPRLELIVFSEAQSTNDTLKIYPTDDTYVRGVEEFRDTVYGFDDKVYYKKIEPEVARIGFVKFDLSAISGTFVSATLNLIAAREGQTGLNYIALSSDDNWSEETRTWNNTFGNNDNVQRIITDYVGTGVISFEVENAASFIIGDEIYIQRTPNQLWCDTLKMSTLSDIDPETTDWTPSSYTINHPRKITDIQGNTVYIDIPIVDPMQKLYGGGKIMLNKTTTTLSNTGVENMYITSVYESETDEDHGWDAIITSNAKNCWVKNVTARYFGYSCVNLEKNSNYFTIQDCALLDPKSITEGGRKYPFPIHGGIGNLIQRCYARGGRHSFATHSRLTGPHVFLDCYATETYADIGPHHRWAAGILYDNVYGGQIRVENRWDKGTGHGWAGVQNMFWNCHSYQEEFKVESPLGGMNWGIGCTAQVKQGDGFWECYGTAVLPRSLYLQQLEDRLGQQAVMNITTQEQRNGRIWDDLADWTGGSVNVSVRNEMHEAEIRVFPNPTADKLNIDLTKLQNENVNVSLYDIQGRCIFSDKTNGGTVFQISLAKLVRNKFIILKLSTRDISKVEKIVIK